MPIWDIAVAVPALLGINQKGNSYVLGEGFMTYEMYFCFLVGLYFSVIVFYYIKCFRRLCWS